MKLTEWRDTIYVAGFGLIVVAGLALIMLGWSRWWV